MSAAGTLNLAALVVLIYVGWGGAADDKCVTLVVKMMYDKMFAFSRLVVDSSCRHLAVHHFHNKDNK